MAKKSEAHWESEAKRVKEKLQVDAPFTKDHVLTFGKHKGKKLKDVPEDYLLWLYTESGMAEQIRLFKYIDQDLPLILGIAHEKRRK